MARSASTMACSRVVWALRARLPLSPPCIRPAPTISATPPLAQSGTTPSAPESSRSSTPDTVSGSATPHFSITRLSRVQISMRVMVRLGANSVADTPFISPSCQAAATSL